MRCDEPERLLAPPRRILLLDSLQLPGLPPEQGALDRLPIEVVAGELELDHYLAVGLRLGPRRWQLCQEVRTAGDQESVAGHLLEPDLGRILPPGRAARRALRLFGKRSLRE